MVRNGGGFTELQIVETGRGSDLLERLGTAEASLLLVGPDPVPREVIVSLTVAMGRRAHTQMRTSWPDGHEEVVSVTGIPYAASRHIVLQPGENRLWFQTDAPPLGQRDIGTIRFRLLDATAIEPLLLEVAESRPLARS
ncbi:MAG: hypothetical protein H0V12_09885 [Chloroflexi bacterium]|nr:hypothetical protein [Chloroflexota bacterium]